MIRWTLMVVGGCAVTDPAPSSPGTSPAPPFAVLVPDVDVPTSGLGLSAIGVLPGQPWRVLLHDAGWGSHGVVQTVSWGPLGLELEVVPLAVPYAGFAAVVDADGDGVQDVVLRTADAITAYDATTWVELWRLELPSLYDDHRGPVYPVQADGDAALEIAVSLEKGVGLYDLVQGLIASTAIDPTWPPVEVDGDASPEVLVGYLPTEVMDLATLQLQGELPGEGFVSAVVDLDQDGHAEVVRQHGSAASVSDLGSGAWRWSLSTGDLVGVRVPVPVRTPGGLDLWQQTNLGPYFLVVDPLTGLVRDAVDRPVSRSYYARTVVLDTDQDGDDEVFTAGNGLIGLTDGTTRRWLDVLSYDWRGQVQGADPDGDGVEQPIVCGVDGVELWDPITLELEDFRVIAGGDGSLTASCAVGDVDGDGDDDVAVERVDGTWDVGGLSATDFTLAFTLGPMEAGPWLLDADNDGQVEIYGVDGAGLCRWQPGAGGADWCVPGLLPLDLVSFDLNGDGVGELVSTGGDPGGLDVLDAGTGAVRFHTITHFSVSAVLPTPAGPRLLVGSRDPGGTRLFELSLDRGSFRLTSRAVIAGVYPSAIRVVGERLLMTNGGNLVAFDTRTGEVSAMVLWEYPPFDASVARSSAMVDGSLRLRTRDGWFGFEP